MVGADPSAEPRTPAERPVSERLPARWQRSPYGLRLALAYAAAFAVGAAALLGLAYAGLGVTLARQDAAYLRDQLGAVERVYENGGIAGVRQYAARLQDDDRGEEVLIRLTDPAGTPLLLVLPDAWETGDVAALRDASREPLRIENARERQSLDVLTRRLGSGDRLQVGFSSDERDDALEALPRVFPLLALPLVLLALLGGWLMAGRALRPLRALVGTLEGILATGDVHRRAPTEVERGEIAALLGLFNRTLDRIEALVGQTRSTLDDVAHDLRTPLTTVRGTAEWALIRERDGAAYRDALGRVVDAAEGAQETLDTILDAAEAEAGALALDSAPMDLHALAASVADLYELVADEKGVALTFEAGSGASVTGDRRRLRRALANLVDNAVKYTPPGGRIHVRAGRDAREAWVAVQDTGMGIAADEQGRIWDRLYRSDRARHERGLGLGLGLARAIAEAHGGRITVSSAAGEGSTFTLSLPAA